MTLTTRTQTWSQQSHASQKNPVRMRQLTVTTRSTSMLGRLMMTLPTSNKELSFPHERSGKLPRLLTSPDFQGTLQISHQLDALFLSEKEIETPLGMDDTQQNWKWADVGSRRMPRSPLTYPTVMVDDENGIRRPAVSQVHHRTLFQWIVDNLSWLSQYDTVYVFVDNRMLSGTNRPEYWQYLAPWIKGRCEVTGPYREKTTAIHIPISSNTGLHQVHYTWAGAAVLEALCLVFPTVNFALADSDCVPTSLFEVAELVNLMTDKASRAEAMQHYTMASSSQCPPAVLLTTEAKAETQRWIDHSYRTCSNSHSRCRHGPRNPGCQHATS